MPERSADWLRQAKRDLRHAVHSLEDKDYEWACFASQQAAEKAVKALYQTLHGDIRGHVISQMLGNLPTEITVPGELIEAALRLDKLYITTRYPNGFERGTPGDFYTSSEAQEAISYAEGILHFCEGRIP